MFSCRQGRWSFTKLDFFSLLQFFMVSLLHFDSLCKVKSALAHFFSFLFNVGLLNSVRTWFRCTVHLASRVQLARVTIMILKVKEGLNFPPNLFWSLLYLDTASVGESNRFGCCGFSCADLQIQATSHRKGIKLIQKTCQTYTFITCEYRRWLNREMTRWPLEKAVRSVRFQAQGAQKF